MCLTTGVALDDEPLASFDPDAPSRIGRLWCTGDDDFNDSTTPVEEVEEPVAEFGAEALVAPLLSVPLTGVADATPGQLATASPTPNVTASAPTRPTYIALLVIAASPRAHTLVTWRCDERKN